MKNLKLLNKYIIRFLMTVYCIATAVFMSKVFMSKVFIYINAHETETNEIFERLKLLLLSCVNVIDSIDGWGLFTLVFFVLVIGTIILHFIQKKILDGGEILSEDDNY